MISATDWEEEPCDECRQIEYPVAIISTRSGLKVYLCRTCLETGVDRIEKKELGS
jgi:hypothetical protein